MTEKQFFRAAIDEYFNTGNRFYQAHGLTALVDFNTVTLHKINSPMLITYVPG